MAAPVDTGAVGIGQSGFSASPVLRGAVHSSWCQAVLHSGSPLLVVAGDAARKTRVLTRRIAYLVGGRARLMWVSTFHAACVRILRSEARRFGCTSSSSIYDQADSQRLMTLVCRELDLDPRKYPPKQFSHAVSDFKNHLVDHETAASRAEPHHLEMIAEAYWWDCRGPCQRCCVDGSGAGVAAVPTGVGVAVRARRGDAAAGPATTDGA